MRLSNLLLDPAPKNAAYHPEQKWHVDAAGTQVQLVQGAAADAISLLLSPELMRSPYRCRSQLVSTHYTVATVQALKGRKLPSSVFTPIKAASRL